MPVEVEKVEYREVQVPVERVVDKVVEVPFDKVVFHDKVVYQDKGTGVLLLTLVTDEMSQITYAALRLVYQDIIGSLLPFWHSRLIRFIRFNELD